MTFTHHDLLVFLVCIFKIAVVYADNPFGLSSTADVSCIPYTGSGCSDSLSGATVLVPNDLTISSIEAAMNKQGFNLVPFLQSSYPNCIPVALFTVCDLAFPQCDPKFKGKSMSQATASAISQLPCQSVCQETIDKCTSVFIAFGKQNLIPKCQDVAFSLFTTNRTLSSSTDCMLQDGTFSKKRWWW